MILFHFDFDFDFDDHDFDLYLHLLHLVPLLPFFLHTNLKFYQYRISIKLIINAFIYLFIHLFKQQQQKKQHNNAKHQDKNAMTEM